MASEKTDAVVLRLTEFSESSLVVTLFTRDFGLAAAIAKGARRPKSAFEGALDLLCLCRVVIIRKSGDSLDILTEAKLEKRFRAGQKNLRALYAGYYVAEVIRELTQRDAPHPELFDSVTDTLSTLDSNSLIDLDTELMRFELRTLKSLGHAPTLESCAVCGVATAMAQSNDGRSIATASTITTSMPMTPRVPFSPIAGGVLCDPCRHSARGTILLRPATVAWFQAIFQDTPRGVRAAEIARESVGEARAAITQTITHLCGAPLRLTRYLSGTH